MHYEATGSGPALVLVHGFTESSAIWADFAGELSASSRVIMPDLPGHGRSECLGQGHSMTAMAEVLHAVLAREGVRECVMVGHSMGGYVALAFARKYPAMLRGLGLFHSTALPDSPEAKAGRTRAIELIRKDRQGFLFGFIPELFAPGNRDRLRPAIDRLVAAASQMSAEAVIMAQEGMRDRGDGRDVLFSLHCPVLFIAGQKDSRVPFETIRELSGIPAISYCLYLKESGHMGYLEARDETLGMLRFFARTCL